MRSGVVAAALLLVVSGCAVSWADICGESNYEFAITTCRVKQGDYTQNCCFGPYYCPGSCSPYHI